MDKQKYSIVKKDCIKWMNAQKPKLVDCVITSPPYNLNIKYLLVQTLEKQSQISQATQLCEEILSYDPTEPRALKFLKKYGAR